MHARTNRHMLSGLTAGILGATVIAAGLHPTPLMLAIIGASLMGVGLLAGAFVAMRNRRSGAGAMDGMLVPALLMFAGCAATILCDIDAAVSRLN